MCKICEIRDDDVCGVPLFHPTLHLGFVGNIKIWAYVDAYNQQMYLQAINENGSNIIEYQRVCNYCPVCGRDLSKTAE